MRKKILENFKKKYLFNFKLMGDYIEFGISNYDEWLENNAPMNQGDEYDFLKTKKEKA